MSHHIDNGVSRQPALVNDCNIVQICVHAGALMLWVAAVLVANERFNNFFTTAEVLSPVMALYAYGAVVVCRYGWPALTVVNVFWAISVIRLAQILYPDHFQIPTVLGIIGIGLIVAGIYAKRELSRRYCH
ncbi:MAG TPA: hypothetical protein VIY48_09405 [Candidatus Paceibacterota bacterium]